MRRYNIVSRIILILTAITFALAAPVLVQEKRQVCVDAVHVPEDVKTVLGKRTLEEDLNVLWDGWWHHLNVLGEPAPPPLPYLGHVYVPPQIPVDSDRESVELEDDAPPESLGSSTESDSDSDSDRWSTISNAPSAESQSENLKAADSQLIQLEGNAKVSRRISGTASGVDTVNAAQMELRSAIDPGP
jgi:hypothetical protein